MLIYPFYIPFYPYFTALDVKFIEKYKKFSKFSDLLIAEWIWLFNLGQHIGQLGQHIVQHGHHRQHEFIFR